MAHDDCPECQAEVDRIVREMSDSGKFPSDTSSRDRAMVAKRCELLANPRIVCEHHVGGGKYDI